MSILEKLLSQDVVHINYRKKDGTVAPYMLTKRLAPPYVAKTERKARPADDTVITAYDLREKRFLSLKIENIVD
jgi:hypothetical protein